MPTWRKVARINSCATTKESNNNWQLPPITTNCSRIGLKTSFNCSQQKKTTTIVGTELVVMLSWHMPMWRKISEIDNYSWQNQDEHDAEKRAQLVDKTTNSGICQYESEAWYPIIVNYPQYEQPETKIPTGLTSIRSIGVGCYWQTNKVTYNYHFDHQTTWHMPIKRV